MCAMNCHWTMSLQMTKIVVLQLTVFHILVAICHGDSSAVSLKINEDIVITHNDTDRQTNLRQRRDQSVRSPSANNFDDGRHTLAAFLHGPRFNTRKRNPKISLHGNEISRKRGLSSEDATRKMKQYEIPIKKAQRMYKKSPKGVSTLKFQSMSDNSYYDSETNHERRNPILPYWNSKTRSMSLRKGNNNAVVKNRVTKVREGWDNASTDLSQNGTSVAGEHRGAMKDTRQQQYENHMFEKPDDGNHFQHTASISGQSSKSIIKKLCNVTGPRRECYRNGDSKCQCTGGLADCSGKKYVPNMWYAPKLPKSVKCLQFTFNNVKSLDDSYFANVSSFIVVDFSDNKLEKVSAKTFARFTHLNYLILNRNILSYKTLRPVFDFPPSFRLDIIDQGLKEIPKGYFKRFVDMPTEQIFMDFNYIPHLDLGEFSQLPHLQYLSLNNCSISNLTTSTVSGLKVLDLTYNKLRAFPHSCVYKADLDSGILTHSGVRPLHESSGSSYFPALTELYLGGNHISDLPNRTDSCFQKLETLHIFSNNISVIPEHAFSAFTSLEALILNKLSPSGIVEIGPRAFATKSITTIYMSKTKIDFQKKNISNRMFEGCTSLEVLVIDHNEMGFADESTMTELFSFTKQLRFVYLGSNNLTKIPSVALSQLPRLTNLYLYVNNITNIPDDAFETFPSLKYLELDENDISNVGRFSHKMQTQLKVIDISRNPFICDCQLLWFQDWLKSAPKGQFKHYNQYLCADRPGRRVTEYFLSKQACLMSRSTYILFVVCLSVMLAIFIVFSILFRYRWNIRLVLYERRAAAQQMQEPDPGYEFDLFIVFCNDDEDWVTDRLLPVLETKWQLRVCHHQRDFWAGNNITDNIVHAMNASSRILVVLSSRFALSRWCTYELQLCQSHIITHDLPSLLVIQLEAIQSRDMTAAMFALYNTTCFLQMDPDHVALFWRRLHKMLQPLINRKMDQRRGLIQ